MSGTVSCSGRQLSTNLSPTCMSDSMARSFATATVKPSGEKDACATQEAIMALRASPRAAVTR